MWSARQVRWFNLALVRNICFGQNSGSFPGDFKSGPGESLRQSESCFFNGHSGAYGVWPSLQVMGKVVVQQDFKQSRDKRILFREGGAVGRGPTGVPFVASAVCSVSRTPDGSFEGG